MIAFGKTLFLFLAVVFLAGSNLIAAETLRLELIESSGIARFGYPVEAILNLPREIDPETKFRLLANGKPVAAQFRPFSDSRPSKQWKLNFNASLKPYGSRIYLIEYGDDVSEAPKSRRGLTLQNSEQEYLVANEPYLNWTVKKNLAGLLPSLKAGKIEQLRGITSGLVLQAKNGKRFTLGTPDFLMKSNVVRQGPIAIDLHFEQAQEDELLPGVHATVDLQFVNSKSWIRVDWTIDDPRGEITRMESLLQMDLEQPQGRKRTLVDFSGTSYVYLSLGKGETADLQAGLPLEDLQRQDDPQKIHWQVSKGKNGTIAPFVTGPRHSVAFPEGWAHVMDSNKCLAVAVDDFARWGKDAIEITADGKLSLSRDYSSVKTSGGKKRFRFWYHFVTNPPHISAATSPQSMQLSLKVRLLDAE